MIRPRRLLNLRRTAGDRHDWPQNDTVAVFNVSLKQGQTMLRGTFLDDQGKEICGAYYVSVRRL